MSEPIIPPRTYLLVFAALIILTLTTVGIAHIELGAWHTVVGMSIALVKAVLIILFFMHVIHSQRLTWIIALSGLFWLGLMMGGTMNDYLTRAWPTNPGMSDAKGVGNGNPATLPRP